MEKEKPKKMKLGFYPYTYVRSNVMRTLLIKKEDYHKLMKMTFTEITRYLQESIYKTDIDKLATELSGTELLEIALNRNLESSFEKLRRISPKELNILIENYLKRKDIEDIKTLMRGKYINADKNLIINSLQAAGTLSMDYLKKLVELESIQEILKNIKIFDFSEFKDPIMDFEEKNALVSIENKLDQLYYQEILEFTKSLPVQGSLFKDFLLQEIEIKNLITLIRLKREKLDKKDIRKYLFFSGDRDLDSNLNRLLDADLGNIIKILERRPYSKILESGFKDLNEKNSLINLEIGLYKYLLDKSILLQHQNPLSIDVILGYMFAKEIEVRNLKILVKGKQLNMTEEFIENQLVV
jgi:V/A-type H+-transporting ATPase subunit C|tara:strand:+ start:160 stop:1224 length:1065 start_codon:yes stop_codon:yes gene_type:complete